MPKLLLDSDGVTTAGLIGKLKSWWPKRDKEGISAKLSTGVSVGSIPVSDPDTAGSGAVDIGGNVNIQHLTQMLILDQGLMLKYGDWESMDDYAELSLVLDVYADDSTVPDSIRNRTVWARSKDGTLRDIIDDCLTRRLDIDAEIWLMSRSLCKMGNLFAEVLLTKDGVMGLNFLPAPTMRRLVTPKGGLIGFVQDVTCQFNIAIENGKTINDLKKIYKDQPHIIFFHPWQVVHWRLRSKHIRALYGTSVYDSARWMWKRLRLLEDTSLMYKLTRSPSRFAFYIDTGDLPPADAKRLLNDTRRDYRKKTLINQQTGKLDFRHEVISPGDDMWITTRGGKESTRVETVGGLEWNVTDDLEYYRNKMLSSTKVPSGFANDDGNDSKSSLAQKDVRFARAAMRVQRELKNGLRKVVRLHLAVLGIDPDTFEWDLEMTVPSAIFEMQQIEVMNAQADLAERLKPYFSDEWVLRRVLHMADDEATAAVSARDNEIDKKEKDVARIQNDIQKMYPGLVVSDQPQQGEDNNVANMKMRKQLESLNEAVKENIQKSRLMIEKIDKMGEKLLKESIKNRKAMQ